MGLPGPSETVLPASGLRNCSLGPGRSRNQPGTLIFRSTLRVGLDGTRRLQSTLGRMVEACRTVPAEHGTCKRGCRVSFRVAHENGATLIEDV